MLEKRNRQLSDKNNSMDAKRLILYSTIIGFTPGLFKEIADNYTTHKTWSGPDLVYDFAGALIGSSLTYSIHRLFDSKDDSLSLSLNTANKTLLFCYSF